MQQCYVCGGAVRDVLLGYEPKDIDFVWTGSTFDEMIQRGFQPIQATNFPVFLDEHGNEHALARIEKKNGKGYHGFDITFDSSVTIKDDLFRRDITINSLAVRVENWEEFKKTLAVNLVIDPYGGLCDLKTGTIRHTSLAFKEDAVRILRVARFSARYGFDVAPDTLDLIEQMTTSGELDYLVPERVWAETEKAIMEPTPYKFFHVLEVTTAINAIFPELKNVKRYWNITCGCNAQERFAILADSVGPSSHRMFKRLKAPSNLHNFIFKFTLLTHWVRQQLDQGHPLTAESILWVLKTNDCFRDTRFILEATSAAEHIDSEICGWCETIGTGLMVASAIGFDHLTDDQRNTLKGKAIGEAINELRLNAIRKIS